MQDKAQLLSVTTFLSVYTTASMLFRFFFVCLILSLVTLVPVVIVSGCLALFFCGREVI